MDSVQAVEEFEKLLGGMEKFGASDLHLKVGSPPIYRVSTKPQKLKKDSVTEEFVTSVGNAILKENQVKQYEVTGAADFAYSVVGKGRFRVNYFRQRGAHSIVARRVPFDVPTISDLHLPASIAKLADMENGIALVVGMTGSGKSTTLAAILNQINHQHRSHILTIEDPIEYLHKDERSFINQREIGSDAPDFATALRSALRQDPDIILVGEIRDCDTMETALSASETGHLVFGTLHATNVAQTIMRILDFFEDNKQDMARQVLSHTIQAIAAQQLLPGAKTERPLVVAVELMLANSAIRKFISEGDDNKVQDSLRAMSKDGMQDFNMALMDLVKGGWITKKIAMQHSPNPEQLSMNLKGMVLSAEQSSVSV